MCEKQQPPLVDDKVASACNRPIIASLNKSKNTYKENQNIYILESVNVKINYLEFKLSHPKKLSIVSDQI